ncbi:hypothetical protein [Lactobacillus paraplantarum] [Lactiplantibacillus mudanjiangensis]|uniref:Uncharacterized protein n=1 Tax=Lactiplantibacillus mudanjiangensis TaxID=1296538 RepID=A0A660E6E0_9LACO|nr:hypothetical protein [Lactobacillus paraplantarum] [Lactiplantibacillus mudanjiangensis]VDG25459.1 hypothetical protein [Lactobacillus paraplantarum] [Lactiplantibacillus mudanjiangensis]VDG28577.1 hypothetical protein [Lactobacillus paraplantarum] [Lactiplantibacillus mudanjiangensis]VDG31046.1 hypothetical protein [Lactobacillus paraplantarum] [Lactiplantibacillus mudanjiangensis]
MNHVDLYLADDEHLSYQSTNLGNTASDNILSAQTLRDLVIFANNLNIKLIFDVDTLPTIR